MIITIDGPSGSGKSTIAKKLAATLQYHHLQTSLFYRGLAYCVMQAHNIINEPTADELVQYIARLHYVIIDGIGRMVIDGVDITNRIMQRMFDQPASVIGAYPSVRTALLPLQRAIAAAHNIIAEGRDCGSIVFPHAELKIYLTARTDVRAKRMHAAVGRDYKGKTLEEIECAIKERDERDVRRATAPLTVPAGALVIDTSDQSVDAILTVILTAVHRLNQKEI